MHQGRHQGGISNILSLINALTTIIGNGYVTPGRVTKGHKVL
jgi:hypothetical protein